MIANCADRPEMCISGAQVAILYLTPERHPSVRADIAALFGKYLPRFGFRVDLLAQAAEPGAIADWPGGRNRVWAATGRRNRDTLFGLAHQLGALCFGSLSDYDVVVVRDMPSIAAVAWVACRLRGKASAYWMSFPIVESYRILADLGPRRIGWSRWLYARLREHSGRLLLRRVVLPGADHVFVQSDTMRESLFTKGCSSGRTTAVPMGVDLEAMAIDVVEVPTEPRLSGRECLIYVGTFSALRQLDILIQGFALAWRDRPTIVLIMVGREEVGGETAALQATAARLGVAEHVVWTGWLPRAAAAGLVRAAKIGLSIIPRGPLFDVSSPTKLCEYLAMGVPGLVSDIPDQVLVARRSQAANVVTMVPEAIADGILTMLADPKSLSAMGARGPAYVRSERSYGVIAGQVAKVLAACSQRSVEKRTCQ